MHILKNLTEIKIFRFNPTDAKKSTGQNRDNTELNQFGDNLAGLLAHLEKNKEIQDEIMDLITFLVPEMELVSANVNRLDGRYFLQFKEKSFEKLFPAHLISDGTIYALCIITAVLSQSKNYSLGSILIEEPERGIHPKAIQQLIEFMHEKSNNEIPIWITTHSESVVRASKIEELWLVDKKEGQTIIKNPNMKEEDLEGMNLDDAWLTNFLNGGLPW